MQYLEHTVKDSEIMQAKNANVVYNKNHGSTTQKGRCLDVSSNNSLYDIIFKKSKL